MSIEKLVPAPLRNQYRQLRSRIKNGRLGDDNAAIFDAIYRDHMWGEGDTSGLHSGSGSYDPSVPAYVDLVQSIIARENVRSIVEIGCGDFAIGRQYAYGVEQYLGVDVAASVIAHNRKDHERDGVAFRHADAARDDLPPHDLCLIRQVLQHLSNADIAAIIARVATHRLVLITEHLPGAGALRKPNLDKSSGPDTRLTFGSGVYVDKSPFDQPGETVLETLVPEAGLQAAPGELLRSTLIRNR